MQQRTSNLISLSSWIGVLLLLAVGLSGFSQLSVNLWSRTFLQKIVRSDESPPSPAPSSHRMALTWLAQAALNEDQPQQALELLSPELRAHNPFAQRVVGQSYWNLGKYQSAIRAWVQADDYVSLINNAQSIETDYPEIALAGYQGAQSINPLLGTRPLVTFLRSLPDQSTNAETVLIHAITAYPNAREHAIWQRMLADSLAERDQWQQAERIYQEILTKNPNDYFAWINLGWLNYNHKGDFEEAVKNFEKAISISPDNGFGYFTVGRLMVAEARFTEADQWFQKAVDLNPNNSNWWRNWSDAAIASDRFQRALDINILGLSHTPEDRELSFQQARIYQKMDDIPRATTAVQNAVSIGNLSYWDWLEAGQIYEWAGATNKAIEAYHQVLILMPDNIQAINHLDQLKATGNE